MWLLFLVAVGSGYLANCWRDALLLHNGEEQEKGDAGDEIMSRTCKRLFGNTTAENDNSELSSQYEAAVPGLEVKRMRDSQELDAQNQLFLTALTSSFLDSSSLTNHWLAPTAQDGRVTKSKVPGKPAKSRAGSRRSRYMRASPKPVTSLESCLRAQLHLDEDKSPSQPSVFHPAAGAAGLRQVESLDSSSMVFRGGATNVVSRISKSKPAAVKASVDALLFSFGVGLGVMHTTTANSAEMARLQSRLDKAEKLVQELQVNAAAGNASYGNMADLEAQLEAELEIMQLHSSEEDVGEVVHDQLNVSGLPGASDLEDERNESRNGEVSNWAVSPRELDRRLRLLLETQQEERIAKLEEQLEQTETELHDREEELQLWKERVRLLTERVTSSGQTGEEVREQSPCDDICDEFLKSVDALLDSELSSNVELEEGFYKKEEETSSSHSSSVWKWKYSSKCNAGAGTPLEDSLRLGKNQLLNTPRRPEEGGATVVDKIRYWENVSKGTSNSSNQHQQKQQSPLLRFSCSEISSSCDDDDDDESWASDMEEREMMKRIVEKSRKGSTLLRDVEVMLAALECDSA